LKRVLIATSRAGGGHASVARALALALDRLYGNEVQVAVADPFDSGHPSLVGRLTELYAPIIRRWPALWGAFYGLTDRPRLLKALMSMAYRLSARRAEELVEYSKPDIVASVHPLCHHVLAPILRGHPQGIPLAVVLTDLVCVHAAWFASPADLYLAPTTEAEEALRRAGIPSTRIRRVGLPIDPRFGRMERPEDLRRSLGLDPERFTLLLTGGGEGAGGLESAARAIGRSRLPLQLLVVCGRNGRLERRLRNLSFPVPTRIWGFVTNMPELVGAADVVVTKAGSVSLAEALAAGRPIIIIRAIPGQETGNPRLIERLGAGRAVRGAEELVAELDRLYTDAAYREGMAARARAAGQPDAAYAAAKALVHSLPRLSAAPLPIAEKEARNA